MSLDNLSKKEQRKWRNDLRYFLEDNFGESDTKELVFNLGESYGTFGGDSAPAKQLSLITFFIRRGREEELLEEIETILERQAAPPAQLAKITNLQERIQGGASEANQPAATPPASTTPSATTPPTTTPITPQPVAGQTYENFDIRVTEKDKDNQIYAVEVTRNPIGYDSIPTPQKFPLDDYDFTDLVSLLKDLVARADYAIELGEMMFKTPLSTRSTPPLPN